ncbi:hypothetical protein [Lunatibacter salilacus]|uniref:hypothetical protein n=1 Tax=Lunatibacter salilacus TaxID=2483804 RepID=UPI00131BB2DE|nr:hypothetical protein [Lunatibacter salilacus]
MLYQPRRGFGGKASAELTVFAAKTPAIRNSLTPGLKPYFAHPYGIFLDFVLVETGHLYLQLADLQQI